MRWFYSCSSLEMRPAKQCYWTRKLELDLIEFMKHRDYVWKPTGNTNYHIQQKYKAYAEFAAAVGRGFTARSVRDRWVNIRSTFNHNVHKVLRSKLTAKTPSEVYVPCWPLWKPLQFLLNKGYTESIESQPNQTCDETKDSIKEENDHENNEDTLTNIIESNKRTNRPRHKVTIKLKPIDQNKNMNCKNLLDDLLLSMQPLTKNNVLEDQNYWFFGKHVVERLNSMRNEDSNCAIRDITQLLDEWPS